MGNLGPYEVITTAAKAAGGVDEWIGAIKKAAVADAALKLRLQGAGIGVAGAAMVGGAVVAAAKRHQAAKEARRERAEEAERQLKATVEERP